jgi:hypothetical protein
MPCSSSSLHASLQIAHCTACLPVRLLLLLAAINPLTQQVLLLLPLAISLVPGSGMLLHMAKNDHQCGSVCCSLHHLQSSPSWLCLYASPRHPKCCTVCLHTALPAVPWACFSTATATALGAATHCAAAMSELKSKHFMCLAGHQVNPVATDL